jgi:small subunit ribosomal protein S20
MAHSKQALKRARQSDKARVANKSKLSRMKTAVKNLMAAIEAGDKTKAADMLPKVCTVIDKAAETNVIHANKAARHKSQVTRAVRAMK